MHTGQVIVLRKWLLEEMKTISLSPKFSLPLCYVPSCKMRYSHVGRWLEEQPLLNMSRSSSLRKFLVKGSVTTCFMCLNLPCCFVLNILPLTEIDLIVGYPSIVLENFLCYIYIIDWDIIYGLSFIYRNILLVKNYYNCKTLQYFT